MSLANIVKTLVLDVYDHDQTQAIIKAIALDSKTRYVQATLTYMGADYPVSETATVTLTVLRPDKVGAQVAGSVVDVDNADRTGTIKGVYAELTQTALAVKGKCLCQFKITDGEQILRTEIFAVNNGQALDADIEEWAGDLDGHNLDEMADSIETLEANVGQIQEDLSTVKEGLRAVSDYADKGTAKIYVNDYTQGSLSSGQETVATGRIRSGYIGLNNVLRPKFTLRTGTYQASLHFYAEEDASSWIISSSSWLSDGASVVIPYDANFVRIVVKYSDNSGITPADFVPNSVYIDGASRINAALDSYVDGSNLTHLSEMFGFYRNFAPYALDTTVTGVIKIGTFNSGRCSCVVNLSKDTYLTMTNPSYVFRLYWWEGSTLCHTTWGSTWEVLASIDVGITIKKADGSDFAENEKPQKYLIDAGLYSAPKAYYLNELEATKNKIFAWNDEPGLCFLLSADMHHMSVQGTLQKYDTITDTVVNMKALAESVKFDGNISLGDLTDMKVPTAEKAELYGIVDLSYGNLDAVFRKWNEYAITKLKNVVPNFICCNGNHDDNRYINRDVVQASVSAYDYTRGEMYSYFTSMSADRVSNANNHGLDYYIDYAKHNVRMVVLNDSFYTESGKNWWYGYEDSTVAWFEEVLANTPSDYNVILVTHMSPFNTHNEDTTDYKNITNVRNAISSYITGGGKFLATLYGHTHADWATMYPWTEICFAAGKCQNSNPPSNLPESVRPTRTAGTYTEDCWSTVIIQPSAKCIKVVRFGAGTDRIYHTENQTITAGTTLSTMLEGNVTWSSRYAEIATVTGGVVTPVASGWTMITATSANGDSEHWGIIVSA